MIIICLLSIYESHNMKKKLKEQNQENKRQISKRNDYAKSKYDREQLSLKIIHIETNII